MPISGKPEIGARSLRVGNRERGDFAHADIPARLPTLRSVTREGTLKMLTTSLGSPNRVKLTIATTDYDHFRDFRTGVVQAEGIEHTWLTLGHPRSSRASPSTASG